MHEESHAVTVRVRHITPAEGQGQRSYLMGVEFMDVSPALDDFLARQLGVGNDPLSVEV
jgi:hypothetical protein